MGCGFLEAIYQECLEMEMGLRRVPFISQPEWRITYKGKALNHIYKPDLLCYDKIIVELKAVSEIAAVHEAQIINYLKVTNMKLGILVNLGSYPKASIKRFANLNLVRQAG